MVQRFDAGVGTGGEGTFVTLRDDGSPSQTPPIMTSDALRGLDDHEREPNRQIAIGAPDENIFLCPRCARPLAVGVSRCPGCRTRLVAGVQLLKVIGFVGIGVAAGIVLFGGLVFAIAFAAAPVDTTVPSPAPQASAAVVPSAVPVPSAAPVPVEPLAPPAALAALQQSALVNQRLLADADRLTGPSPRNDRVRGRYRPAPSQPRIECLVRQRAAAVHRVVGRRSRRVAGPCRVLRLDRSRRRRWSRGVTHQRARVHRRGAQDAACSSGLTDLDAASRGLAATADTELPPLVPGRRRPRARGRDGA